MKKNEIIKATFKIQIIFNYFLEYFIGGLNEEIRYILKDLKLSKV